MGGYSRIGVFILILAGIIAYLKTGSTLFLKFKSSGARLQMAAIDRSMHAYHLKKRKYPKNFVSFMRQNFDSKNGKDTSLDPWGFQYKYVPSSDGYTLASAGADGKFGTEDDLSWIREGSSAGMEQGSKFKGEATSKVATGKSSIASSQKEDPVTKDYMAIFATTEGLDQNVEKMSDKDMLKYLESYLEQVILE